MATEQDLPFQDTREPERKHLLGRRDWIKVALEALAHDGPSAVAIARLADKMGVTKGSFYWHFSSREELLNSLIIEWQQHATQRVIQIVESEKATPHEKILRLAAIGGGSPISEFGGALELAMRSWAKSNPEVRAAVADVDRQRMAYLAELYGEIGSELEPALLACLHYAFSAGMRLIFPYSEDEKSAIRDAVIEKIFFPTATTPKKGSN